MSDKIGCKDGSLTIDNMLMNLPQISLRYDNKIVISRGSDQLILTILDFGYKLHYYSSDCGKFFIISKPSSILVDQSVTTKLDFLAFIESTFWNFLGKTIGISRNGIELINSLPSMFIGYRIEIISISPFSIDFMVFSDYICHNRITVKSSLASSSNFEILDIFDYKEGCVGDQSLLLRGVIKSLPFSLVERFVNPVYPPKNNKLFQDNSKMNWNLTSSKDSFCATQHRLPPKTTNRRYN